MKSICVFCGSRAGGDARFQQAAEDLARSLAQRKISLVYGGGRVGLMGVLANELLRLGGQVIGVIPKFMVVREWAHQGISKLHVVESMHQRKALMAELADGFLALPGGIGTLEEFCEVLSWAQLGLHEKPVGLLNVAGFFDHLLKFLDHAEAEQFVTAQQRSLVLAGEDCRLLIERMLAHKNSGVDQTGGPPNKLNFS